MGDDSRAPTYIETVPTLGYRFIAKVETLSAAGLGESHPDAKLLVNQTLEPQHPLTPEVDQDRFPPVATVNQVLTSNPLSRRHEGRSLKWRNWYLLAVLLPVAGGAALWLHSHHRPILDAKKAVVLSDFENSTGDAVFDGTLREGLSVQLEQSPVLSLVSEPRIRNTLRMMSRNPETRLTPVLAREICQRTDSAAMLDGSIASLGSQYVITLHAMNCNTGEVLYTEQVQAVRKEDVLHALSTVASNLGSRLGESISSIRSLDTPLDEATTSSLDALKAFSESARVENQSGSAAAIPLAQRAVELDPKLRPRGQFWVACTEISGKNSLP